MFEHFEHTTLPTFPSVMTALVGLLFIVSVSVVNDAKANVAHDVVVDTTLTVEGFFTSYSYISASPHRFVDE